MKKKLFLVLFALIIILPILHAQKDYSPEYLVPFRKGNLWGYSDTLKNIVIDPKFEIANFFYNDRGQFYATGLKDGQDVLIFDDGNYVKDNTQSNDSDLVIELEEVPNYKTIINPALSVNGKHGFKIYKIGHNSFIEFPPVYNELVKVIDFSDGTSRFAIFKNISDDKLGMVDTLGNILIPFEYSDVELFNSKEKIFKVKNKLVGLIDWKGNLVYPLDLLLIERLTPDIFVARNQSFLYGALDSKGKTILPFKYSNITLKHYHQGDCGYVKASLNGKEFYVSLKGVEYSEE